MDVDSSGLEIISAEECLALLVTVRIGRVAFTDQALPAIQPVSFAVDDGEVVLRTAAGSTLAAARTGIVAFEADKYDMQARTGWYVAITGHARRVHDPDEVAHLSRLSLCSWTPDRRDHFIRIDPEIITGRRVRDPTSRQVRDELPVAKEGTASKRKQSARKTNRVDRRPRP